MALEMRTVCERGDAALALDGIAYICGYERTFCAPCATTIDAVCPNRGGELTPRPRRTRPV
ncbi:DUF1272 domain-containing protein [Nocardia sp. R16R-3T]